MSIPFITLYPELGVFLLFFFFFGSLLWLVSRFQDILQATKSKIKGDLTKMKNNKPKDENIQKVDEFLSNNKTKKSEEKPRAIGRLAGSMLFVAFGLAAMTMIVVMNESFDGITDILIVAAAILLVIMIVCAILIFFVIYLENEIELEEKNSRKIRNILHSAEESRYFDLLQETRRMNRQHEKIVRFIKEKYKDADLD